jgi:hypothetical protein
MMVSNAVRFLFLVGCPPLPSCPPPHLMLHNITDAQIPQTTHERIVATICMLVGASMFAYTVSAIVAVVASFGEERRQYVPCHCCCDTTAHTRRTP